MREQIKVGPTGFDGESFKNDGDYLNLEIFVNQTNVTKGQGAV